MPNVKIAILGIGNIGQLHADNLLQGGIKDAELVCFCDINSRKLEAAEKKYGKNFKFYTSPSQVFQDNSIDAVIISTPHYDHPILAIEALKSGKHALVEKPVGVYTKKVREMLEESERHPELKLALMYNQRMNPVYQKAKELIENGEIGTIRRTNWIITNWYRSQSYYDSGGWRATWAGEGGGVLLNQDPHQLDLWQWICGMPEKVYSFVYYGKYRDIEVETEVTAYVEYKNGASGVFVTTTTELAGVNRFEIVGSKGKIIIEDNKLKFWKSVVDEIEWNSTYDGGFGEPEVWKIDIPVEFDEDSGHKKITQNFINSILYDEKLVSPASDGIYGLSISNAIHLSSWLKREVLLPIDEDLFLSELNKRIDTSKEKDIEDKVLDAKDTF